MIAHLALMGTTWMGILVRNVVESVLLVMMSIQSLEILLTWTVQLFMEVLITVVMTHAQGAIGATSLMLQLIVLTQAFSTQEEHVSLIAG